MMFPQSFLHLLGMADVEFVKGFGMEYVKVVGHKMKKPPF